MCTQCDERLAKCLNELVKQLGSSNLQDAVKTANLAKAVLEPSLYVIMMHGLSSATVAAADDPSIDTSSDGWSSVDAAQNEAGITLRQAASSKREQLVESFKKVDLHSYMLNAGLASRILPTFLAGCLEYGLSDLIHAVNPDKDVVRSSEEWDALRSPFTNADAKMFEGLEPQ